MLFPGIDPQLDNLCRDLWDRFGDMTLPEKTSLANKIAAWPNSVSSSKMNMPIGEAMLQLTADRDPEGGRVFLPFLSEVRVGSQQCEIENDDDSNGLNGFAQTVISPREESVISKTDGSSPPHSPQLRNVDGQELNMDFWPNNPVPQSSQYSYGSDFPPSSSNTTPNSKKDTAKVTIKAHFKTLLVSRSPSSGSLSLTYLKEKRKDKMLQKLGMKKGQKQKPEEGAAPSQVSSIGRMLCSATGKHNELTGSFFFVLSCKISRFIFSYHRWKCLQWHQILSNISTMADAYQILPNCFLHSECLHSLIVYILSVSTHVFQFLFIISVS